jgi:DNA-binding transcriptional LysR family regulator
MRVTEIGETNAFIAVAEHRNFTRAAKSLGISPASLSTTIRTLEERLGLRLLNRTTRSVAPTEAGSSLLLRLRPVIDDYHAAFDSLNAFRDRPAGLLRLTVVPSAAQSIVAPMLPKFMMQYPDIRLEVFVDSANVDIVAQHYDAGIRYVNNVDQDMIAVQVSDEHRWVVVGSRTYFKEHNKPTRPEELDAHNCVRVRLANGVLVPWTFEHEGKTIDMPVTGSLVLNDRSLIAPALAGGLGLAYLPRHYVAEGIAEERLIPVLEDWTSAGYPLCLFYPSRRQMPAALKALVDFMRRNQRGRAEG